MVVDCFKFRNEIGLDVMLKERYARLLRVAPMSPYLHAIE
jgi:hypothetical protein